MSDWNPELYLKFKNERTMPVYDLISRVELDNPKRIIDIGCGPGNSTAVLKSRWPNAEIIGLDFSESMIAKAKKDYPNVNFIIGDASKDLSYLGNFDIVFANASLQWLPEHEKLIPRLFSMLCHNGVLAAQIPEFDRMLIGHAIVDTASLPEWADYFINFKTGMNFYPNESYYDFLNGKTNNICMWSTEYYHVMDNHAGIIEWIKSTGMKPYLDNLPIEKREDFINCVLDKFGNVYPIQSNSKVLFPFKRFFFIAYNTEK